MSTPRGSADLLDRVRELDARQRILELLVRRGRAADAKDPDAIIAEHVPGSRDQHGLFDGTIEEFAEYLRTHHYAGTVYGLQRHTVGDVRIDLESPPVGARVESYHLAYHRLVLADGHHDVVVGGRYLDHCVLHEDRWRLASRTVVYDWSRSATATDHPHRRNDD